MNNNLREVYEKFKHLDKCLSDDLQGEFIHRIAHELWIAIKATLEGPEQPPACEPEKEHGTPSHPASATCRTCRAQKCCVIWECPIRGEIWKAAQDEIRKRPWDNRLIFAFEDLLMWLRTNHADQMDIRNHVDLALGKFRQELKCRQAQQPDSTQDGIQKQTGPVMRCAYLKCKGGCGHPGRPIKSSAHFGRVDCLTLRKEGACPDGFKLDAVDELRGIIERLYDDGFKNPLVTFDAAENELRRKPK
jgi:hypothetical protein